MHKIYPISAFWRGMRVGKCKIKDYWLFHSCFSIFFTWDLVPQGMVSGSDLATSIRLVATEIRAVVRYRTFPSPAV